MAISDKMNWVLTTMNTIHSIFDKAGEAHEKLQNKLPFFLGLSKEDERLWAKLWTGLSEAERNTLTKFLLGLKDYERNHFRYVIVGIPSSEGKKSDLKDKKTGKVYKTVQEPGENNALKFLKELAETISKGGKDGIKNARRQCRAGNIIAKPFASDVLKNWKKGVGWYENTILSPLGVSSNTELLKNLPEIAKEKIIELDENIAEKIPRLEKRGWFKNTFGFGPIFHD